MKTNDKTKVAAEEKGTRKSSNMVPREPAEKKISLDFFAVKDNVSRSRKYYLEYITRNDKEQKKTLSDWRKLNRK